MKNKNQYQALLRGKVESAIAQAKSAAGFSHQGVKGAVLEILLSQLFRPLLPADVGIGTGQIIEQYSGKLSPQIDIIIYNKSILPPILIDGATGLFPIESVLYTIEVKTTLSSSELSSAHSSAKELNEKFGYLPGIKDESGKLIQHKIEKLRSVIFALSSDLSPNGITEAERYKKIYKEGFRYVTAICVAGREYSYEDRDCWVTMRNTQAYDEILAFIGGITNTYKGVSESRGTPLLGYYIVPENVELSLTACTTLPELQVKCTQCAETKKIIPTFDNDDGLILKNYTLSDNKPCKCGGEFKSEKGNFTIKNGRLREIEYNEPDRIYKE
ncbi:hypothetical protein FFZ60_18595 [Salmonella enterica]|nr:hypothetical protein [Salmonella enterica]EAS0128022.1 hypothetical protein [Salmonella enterica]EAS0324355.1 hypothetical protein [Salmonella enterica]EAS1466629.1 hypothetical protein [Salmonella enterica]EAV7394727.1 hypothetical protein [Salmonella enterica]